MTGLPVIYEDDNVIVVDKPAGINVHSGHGHKDESSVADLLHDKLEDDGTDHAGIVHRLDRDTSGVLIIATNSQTKESLQRQFQKRQVKKVYLALVYGHPKHAEAILDWPIARHPKNPMKRAVRSGGKEARTAYKVLEEFKNYSLLEVKPITGRTHQIRVHLSHLGHPVVGDTLYGREKSGLSRQWLHAHKLTIKLAQAERTFTSPLPEELTSFLDRIKYNDG